MEMAVVVKTGASDMLYLKWHLFTFLPAVDDSRPPLYVGLGMYVSECCPLK